MKGCEAYNALCGGNATAVEQCMSPGPIPDVLTTFTAKEGLEVSPWLLLAGWQLCLHLFAIIGPERSASCLPLSCAEPL